MHLIVKTQEKELGEASFQLFTSLGNITFLHVISTCMFLLTSLTPVDIVTLYNDILSLFTYIFFNLVAGMEIYIYIIQRAYIMLPTIFFDMYIEK